MSIEFDLAKARLQAHSSDSESVREIKAQEMAKLIFSAIESGLFSDTNRIKQLHSTAANLKSASQSYTKAIAQLRDSGNSEQFYAAQKQLASASKSLGSALEAYSDV